MVRSVMLHHAGPAVHRIGPLSSNVRPHTPPGVAPARFHPNLNTLMTQDIAKKLHRIASQVDGLNDQGKVKARNEKGYAILFSVSNGCRVWAHHTRDDRLIIDLMYTKSEEFKHPAVVKAAIATFEQFALKSNRQVTRNQWQHSMTESDTRTQHYFEITNDDDQTISELVKGARLTFGTISAPQEE